MQPFSPEQLASFVRHGFVRLDGAFSPAQAAACRHILWQALGLSPDAPEGWTQAVLRLPHLALPPFAAAANTPRLHAAFDQLVGPGRWLPQGGLGSFPIRFPSSQAPGDDGWHVDTSFGEAGAHFLEGRVNLHSKGRALLMLFLLSDVGEADAPTVLRVGSHLDVARQLAPWGEAGLSLGALAADGFATSARRPEALATGPEGTVYLCHPFLVHRAQAMRGSRPRFLAQPPLLPAEAMPLHRQDGAHSPVEAAIRLALADPEA